MRLGAAVKRAAMAGETDNSVMERHEIESDFRKFGNYNKYTFEQSIRPVQVHMEENRLHHAVTPPEVVSPKPRTLGTAINNSKSVIESSLLRDFSQVDGNAVSQVDSSFVT